jgi:hypothetical protein
MKTHKQLAEAIELAVSEIAERYAEKYDFESKASYFNGYYNNCVEKVLPIVMEVAAKYDVPYNYILRLIRR